MSTEFDQCFPLRRGRTHEVCGPNTLTFAFALSGMLGGSVLWVNENWQVGQINPAGFSSFIRPQDLLFAKAKSQTDVLAVAEEALRSGAIPLVVMELSAPINLTTGRRLQLAAEAGQATGLCIIQENMGSNAAESRWRCTPLFDVKDSTLQRWELIKNKSGTLSVWDVKWDAETRRIIVVSKNAQRAGSARAPN
ncbi:MAG: hypothetical protein JKY31_09340 [Rhodobacteraceae bacterium]|nr:hypothetical protein [Paracoccaceae bacterium]